MQTITAQLDQAFRKAIRDAFDLDADPLIGPSQNEKFGDYQSNAAMGLAKAVAEKTGQKTNPRQVAEQIKAKLDLGEMVEEISIAGPGFINVRLKADWLAKQLAAIEADKRIGVEPSAKAERVIVDYSAPNVAKQMHVGHLRSTIIGDALARILEFLGYKVIRQNHIGDWGTQFGMLIAHLKSTALSGNTRIEDLDKFYKEARQRFDSDPAFADEARASVVRLQAGGEEETRLWQKIVAESRNHFQPIYQRMGVALTQQNERGESSYNPLLPAVVSDLKQAGIATESEGAIAVFTEGHEAPIIIEKRGGGFGYATTDLAAVRYRTNTLHATRIIYVVGAPQAQHFQQVFATARKAGWANGVSLEHAGFGSVLGEDGKMFKARSGDSVKLKDLLDEAEQRGLELARMKDQERVAKAQERGETDAQPLSEVQLRAIGKAVGIGAIKYADLSKDRIGDYTFDWDKMLAMDGNTAPYLQYAYARIRSIFRKAGEEPISAPIQLDAPQELSIAKHILRFGEVIQQVARDLKPHLLCTYLYDLATKFSAFYENCPVLKSEGALRASRLALCHVTSTTLALGLDLLGIEHPEQM
ncbi:MAG TPA: arginine--tRNA ligase [Tepidisphaeraceae bacterium]|jgi:arginyl-tRNA synthetase|nr:arginine--tRNA ligase [Tepidisphaeraceae bacterium]